MKGYFCCCSPSSSCIRPALIVLCLIITVIQWKQFVSQSLSDKCSKNDHCIIASAFVKRNTEQICTQVKFFNLPVPRDQILLSSMMNIMARGWNIDNKGKWKYGVLSESSRTRSKKKCCFILLNFGCHLLQNMEHIQRSNHLFHVSKAPWKSFSLMLSSTTCDSLWMSDTVWKHRPFSFIFNLGNKVKSQGTKSSE
jgi:hypothetical protein